MAHIQKSGREHSFDTELAEIHGVEKAILLKNFDYWTGENKRRGVSSMYQRGTWWTEESLSSLSNKYRYMKRGNLSRWINELNEDRWLLLVKTEKGKNTYAMGPVFQAWNNGEDWVAVFQNETGRCFKMKQQVFQNETVGVSNRNNGVFQNETLYIDNIEKNIEGGICEKPAPSQAENFFPSEQKENLKVPGGGGAAAGANYIATTTDADALPGALVRVAEHVVFPGSLSNPISATYRTDLPTRAADGDEAGAIITAWTALNIETVKNKYSEAKRAFASEDLQKLIVKFCGQYSSHADSGTMQRFLSDPALFFKNKLSSWLMNQSRFDKMAEPRVPAGMQPTEQRYTAPKSAEKVPAYTP